MRPQQDKQEYPSLGVCEMLLSLALGTLIFLLRINNAIMGSFINNKFRGVRAESECVFYAGREMKASAALCIWKCNNFKLAA
jgi:hypothetical protein